MRLWDLAFRLLVGFICLHEVLVACSEPLPPGLSDCSAGVVRSSCSWATRTAGPGDVVVAGAWPQSGGGLPSVVLPGQQQNTGTALGPVTGFSLTLTGLVLANAALVKPDASDVVPILWPVQLYTAPASNLHMTDVRVIIDDNRLQSYVAFFRADSTAVHHTDGHSFLHIAAWSNSNTKLQSVTLLSTSACQLDDLQPADSAFASTPATTDPADACGVKAVDYSTLLPTLTTEASIVTLQPLLVLIMGNVTLGTGLLPGAISIARPVVFAGLSAHPTSVELGMVVNQMNVTGPDSQVFWQSVVLENAAPGDALSAVLAPPYSTAISANIWAMYCNRSHNCLSLFNTTTVVATPAEMDYLAFKFSAFNSPLPSMQRIAGFYQTDIMVKYVQFAPGPGDFAITILRMESLAWMVVDDIISSVAVVAKQLPLPPGLAWELERTRDGPLVQTVDSCNRLEAAIRYPKQHVLRTGRLNVWMMLGNLTLDPADPTCWEDQDIAFATQLYGQQLHERVESVTAQRVQQGALLGTASPAPAETDAPPTPKRSQVAPLPDQFAFNFQHVVSALRLPPNADETFLLIQNVTLGQLPQGPNVAAGQLSAMNGDEETPPDVWTILLWSIARGTQKESLYLSHAQLMLPRPEFNLFHSKAADHSFALQLTGGATIVVTGVAASDTAVWLQTVHGPGMAGDNIVLLPDPDAVAAMPAYVWPFVDSTSTATTKMERQRKADKAAVGASIGGAALIALLAGMAWKAQKRRLLQQAAEDCKAYSLPECMKHDIDTCDTGHRRVGPKAGTYEGKASTITTAVDCQVDSDQVSSKTSGPCCVTASIAAAVGAPDTDLITTSTSNNTCSPTGSASSCPSKAVAPDGADLAAAASNKPILKHADSISAGIAQWRSAIHKLTQHLIERSIASSTSGTTAGCASPSSGQPLTPAQAAMKVCRPEPTRRFFRESDRRSPRDSTRLQSQDWTGADCLQLQQMIGRGSFGAVYQGTWHGKRVAVKIMQLPASAPLWPDEEASAASESPTCQIERPHQSPLPKQRHPPHTAIMETVISSTLSHPNVVQVYTYMLNPLTVGAAEQPTHLGSALSRMAWLVTGWELRLVMEYCDQGSLREALSCRSLQSANPKCPYLPCSVALSLAHDVAAAMMHLHGGGVVHGDLKAANILLRKDNNYPGSVWAATVGDKVTAKVADFGLAFPLDPNSTHLSMAARGTPTHMAPELFISGHVSKASDVYAFGILLFEISTSQCAYAGVSGTLLPHEVAMQGLRPTWPSGLPKAYKPLQQLAEACWAHSPHNRPTFVDVLRNLESFQIRSPATELQQTSGTESQCPQQQQHMQETSAQQRTSAAAVNRQLQERRQTAEQQLQLVEQSTSEETSRAAPVAMAVIDLNEIVWSVPEDDAGMLCSTMQQY